MNFQLEPLPRILSTCEYPSISAAISATPARGLVWYNPHTNLFCISGLSHEYTCERHLGELAHGTEYVSDLRLVAYSFTGAWHLWGMDAAS
jgi:hypothetical protein